MRTEYIFLIYLFTLFSCSNQSKYYKDVFNLSSYQEINYDLYNPILNELKVENENNKPDSSFSFTGYFKNNKLQFLLYRSESYGYLFKLNYNNDNKLRTTDIYPLLNYELTNDNSISRILYYYKDNELRIIKNELEDKIIFLENNELNIYEGLLNTSDFNYENRTIEDYFIKFLSR